MCNPVALHFLVRVLGQCSKTTLKTQTYPQLTAIPSVLFGFLVILPYNLFALHSLNIGNIKLLVFFLFF